MDEAWTWIKAHKWLAIGGGVGVFALVLLLTRGSSAAPSGDSAVAAEEAAAASEQETAAAGNAASQQTQAQLSAVQDQDSAAVAQSQIQSNTALGVANIQLQDDTQATAATTAQTQIAADSASALASIQAGVADTNYNDQLALGENTNATQLGITQSNNTVLTDQIDQNANSTNLETASAAQTSALSIAAQEQANQIEGNVSLASINAGAQEAASEASVLQNEINQQATSTNFAAALAAWTGH
jgi:hypothetical protein